MIQCYEPDHYLLIPDAVGLSYNMEVVKAWRADTKNRHAHLEVVQSPAVKLRSTAMQSSDLFALREKVRDLRREYQRTAVVALDEFDDDLGSLLRLVFLEEVACSRKDRELEFACKRLEDM